MTVSGTYSSAHQIQGIIQHWCTDGPLTWLGVMHNRLPTKRSQINQLFTDVQPCSYSDHTQTTIIFLYLLPTVRHILFNRLILSVSIIGKKLHKQFTPSIYWRYRKTLHDTYLDASFTYAPRKSHLHNYDTSRKLHIK